MRNLALLFIFLLGVVRAYSQNPDFDEDAFVNGIKSGWPNSPLVSCYWTSLPNAPNAVSRSCCAYVIIGGTPYLYQFGGGSSSELIRVARLNLTTNTWQNNYSTMPYQISAGTAIVMKMSVLYMFLAAITVRACWAELVGSTFTQTHGKQWLICLPELQMRW